MAKVKGPCLSIDARGNLAQTIVYSFKRGVNIVKWYTISADPRTLPQILQRGLYSKGVEEWNLLTPEQKDSYNIYIDGNILTGFNYYMKEFLLYNSVEEETIFAILISTFFNLHLLLYSLAYRSEFLMNRLFFEEGIEL